MSRFTRMAVASVAMVMLVVNLSRASVLDSVPGEAMVVLKVTNLKGTSDKLAKFATDLGVAALVPPLADPISALQEILGVKNGVDLNGDLAFVFVDPAAVGDNPEQAIMVLVPITDYAAFTGNFPDAKTEGNITTFNFATGEPGHASNWGKFALISPKPEIHALKPAGLKFAGVTAKELNKDIVLLANGKNLRAKLQPLLAEGREELIKTLEEEIGKEADMAKFAPTIKVAVNRLMDVADSWLRDSEASTVAVNFVPEGLNFSVTSEFTAGSYLGDFAAKAKNTSDTFTAGLPAGKYLAFGGMLFDGAHDMKLIDDIAVPVLDELRKTGGKEAEAVDKVYGHFREMLLATKGQHFGLLAPQGELGTVALLQGINVTTGDAAKIKANSIALMEGQTDLMNAFGLPNQMSYTVNRGAKTVDGIAFDQVKGEMKMDGAGPEVEQMIKFMYGPEGMLFNFGEVAPDKILQTFGVADADISKAIASAKGNTDALAALPQVKLVAAQLPSAKSGAFYIQLDEIVTTGLAAAKQFGMGVNVQIQPDLPPLGVSLATEGNAIRIDAHASTQLISQLVAAGFQIGMQMQGGGNRGGGPGGL